MPKNDPKTRFKMYKAGKIWFTMGTTFLSVVALNTAIVSANEQSSTAVSESEKIENKPVETLDTYELTSDAKVSEVTTDVESDKKTEAVTAAPEENKQTNDIRTNEQSTSDNVEKQAAEEQEIETKEETIEPVEQEINARPENSEKLVEVNKELKTNTDVKDNTSKKTDKAETNPKLSENPVSKASPEMVTTKADIGKKEVQSKKATVSDPDYPQNMWLDKDENHYNFQQLVNRSGTQQVVFSTNRTGDGVVYVFVINSSTQQVLRSYVLQRGTSVRLSNGAIVYNDGQYSGLFEAGSSRDTWARGYALGAYNPSDFFTNVSYFVPELIEQTVSYVDEKGNNIIDINGQEIKPEVQQGLTGQKYTTSEPKLIEGFYTEHYLEKPDNAEGTMSQFGEIGAKYERNFHDGSYIIFTQLDEHGTMQADVYENGVKQMTYRVAAGDASQRYQRKYGRGTITIANPYVSQTRNVVYRYKLLGNLVPDVPGSKPVPYPNNPEDNTKPGNPIIPDIPGYTPVDPNGNPLTPGDPYPVNPSKPGEDTLLHYEANEQKAQVEFIDEKTGNIIKVTKLNGKTNSKSDYRTTDDIKQLELLGYELVADNYPADGVVFDGDAASTQSFQVLMKHKTKTITPTEPGNPGEPVDPTKPDGPKYPEGSDQQSLQKIVDRTIKYVDNKGNTVSKSVTDRVKMTRDATIDLVTGEITYGEWQVQGNAFKSVKSPVIKGMYADKSVVLGIDINAETKSIEETVTYYPLGQLVPDVPGSMPVPYPNNPDDSGKPGDPIIPEIPGYTPVDPDGKPLTPGDSYPVDKSKPGEDTSIHYEANEQQAQVEFYDQDTGKVIKVESLTGKTGSKSLYRTKDTITELEAKGYELVSDNYPADGIVFDGNDEVNQNFRVVLKHKMKTVTPTEPGKPGQPIDPANPGGPKYPNGTDVNSLHREINRNIKFVDTVRPESERAGRNTRSVSRNDRPLGPQVAEPITQRVTFDRQATIDMVTGEVTYTEWTTDNDTMGEVKTPIIENRFADRESVTEQQVNPEDGDIDEVVLYFPLGNLVPDVPGAKPVPYPNDGTDATKPGNPIIPDIPGFTPVDPDGKPLTPGEPYPVDPTKPGDNTDLHYEANSQQAQVEFVDAETGNLIKVDTLTGKTGEKSSYRTKDQIAELESKGYELVSDNYPSGGVVFDDNDDMNQKFRVILKHKTKTVTPTEPGTPGQPIDPSNPDGPKYPDGSDLQSLQKVIDRTIKYVDNKGKVVSDTVKESVTFDREATFDIVTGEIKYTEWQAKDDAFKDVKSPIIEGFFADKTQIDGKTVVVDEESTEETVTYSPLGNLVPDVPGAKPVPYPNDQTDAGKPGNPIIPEIPGFTPVDPDGKPAMPGNPYPVDPSKPGEDTKIHYEANEQQAQVEFFDKDTGKVIKVDRLTGKTGSKSPYRTKGKIAELESKGYELVSDNYPADGIVFDNNDAVSQNFRVILKHKTKTVTPTEPGTPGQPIDPAIPDGPKYPDGTDTNSLHREIKRNIKFVDTVRRDQVNSKSAKNVPTVSRNDRPLGPDVSAPITQSVSFDRQATVDLVTGEVTYTEWTSENSVMSEVITPIIEGRFADRQMVTELHVNPDDDDIDEVVMYFPFGNLVPDVPGSTPVPYPNDGTDATKPGNPIIPDIPGFTPVDPEGNPLTPGDPYPVNPNKPGDDTSVHYEANDQKAQVEFFDQDTGKVIKVESLTGKTGSKSPYRTKDQIAELEAKGYELLSDDYPADGVVFDVDNKTNQKFRVVLKHKTQTVTPDNPGQPGKPVNPTNPEGPKYPNGTEGTQLKREINRTIKYVDQQGNEIAQSVQETITFTREATFDLVTGEVTYGEWQVQRTTFDAIKSPMIDGMTPDKAEVPESEVTADSADINEVITYSPVEEVIPDVPEVTPTPEPDTESKTTPKVTPIPDTTPDITPNDVKNGDASDNTLMISEGKIQKISDVKEDVLIDELPESLPETGSDQRTDITRAGIALLTGLLGLLGFAKIRKYFK